MMFPLKPSLEHMALVKFAISLWNQNDIRDLILKLSSKDLNREESWETIEERIEEKVPHFSLPHLLKEKVLGAIKPIGVEILEWMQTIDRYSKGMDLHHTWLCIDLSSENCWTPQGTIDRKRVAKILVKDKNLDILTRYKLACDNCLVDDIIRLWSNLPQDLKDYDYRHFPVINFWSQNMKGGGVRPIPYRNIFFQSAINDNKVAAEYFLQRLNLQEREEWLVTAAKYTKNADVLCFLLSELNEEKQKEVFKSECYRSRLICFLHWPLQGLFVGVANCMWDRISKMDFYNTLKDIICKIQHGYKDCDYQKLFGEFWEKSPNSLRSLIANEIATSWLLPYLFEIKDKENIRLILNEASFTAKEKFMCSDTMKYFSELSIHENEWDFLEFCIRDNFPSEKELLKFKAQIKTHRKGCSIKRKFPDVKYIWNNLFDFPVSRFCKCDKSVEFGESSSSG